MAPQVMAKGRKSSYNALKADVWSLGVAFYQALCFKLPFSGANLTEYKENVKNLDLEMAPLAFNFTRGSDTQIDFELEYPDLYRLLPRMLDKNETTRISASELLMELTGEGPSEDKTEEEIDTLLPYRYIKLEDVREYIYGHKKFVKS